MNALQIIRAMGPIDVRNVWRDSLLRWMVGASLMLGVLLRFGVPALTVWLAARHEFDLVAYYPLLMSCVVLAMTIIVGTIIGFLLLDERDDQTLSALQVTPLSMRSYLLYRLTLPMLVNVPLTVVVFWIAGVHTVSSGQLLLVAVVAGPLAPLFALYLAGFAANKVQGFALTKASVFITMPPLVAWFVDTPRQYLFGVVPTYWPAKIFWQMSAGSGNSAALIVIGVAFELLLLWLLVKRFEQVIRR